jgi:omega-amidase
MHLHLIQKHITNTDLVPFIERAEEKKADLVCFGELAATGCLYEKPREVVSLDEIKRLLSPYKLHIMLGLPTRSDAGLFNSYLHYYRGEIKLYHKINLFPPFNEPEVFIPGDQPGVWDTELGRFGVGICFDIRFDSVFEALRPHRPDWIVIPAAFPRKRIDMWRRLVVERATQTGVPVIGINSVGDDGTNEFGGRSMVAMPDGTVRAEADEISETVVEVEL